MEKIKVVVLTGGELETKEIDNKLENLQEIVGGYIEIPYLSEVFGINKIDIIINADGKYIDGLNKEIAIVNKATNRVVDIVVGNCIFASHDEMGNAIGLSEEQVAIVKEVLKTKSTLYNPIIDKTFETRVLFV